MNWLKKIFGYRSDLAPSGSLSGPEVYQLLQGFCLDARSTGLNLVTYKVANTNSMVPTFDTNAILLAELVPFEELREGDIVTYWRGSAASRALVVHRLNERRPKGWWPLGDNNSTMDMELVTPDNFDRRICGIFYGAKAEGADR